MDGNVTLSGSSGITGDKGTLKQTILDDARVTYTDRHVKAGEIRNVGRNVTITLNNSSIHFDGEIPAVDLVVQGSCTLGGSGTFPGTITYAPGGALSVEGDISLPSSSLTLGRVHVSVLDGVPQKSAVQPESPSCRRGNTLSCLIPLLKISLPRGRAGIRWACSSSRKRPPPSP